MFEENKNKKLIKLSKLISKYCVGMEGNVSTIDYDGFLIKASGSRLDSMTYEDIVKYDWQLNQITNFHTKGSLEIGFHYFLLSTNQVSYVAHSHPINTLKILCSKRAYEFAEDRIFPDQVVFNGKKSCIVPYRTPGNELAEAVKESVDNFIVTNNFFPKLILLMNHGIIACGNSVEECSIITDICEKSAEIFLSTDYCYKLSTSDINKLLNDKNEKYRQGQL